MYVVTGEWPRQGMHYHGGKITNGIAQFLLQENELVGVQLEQYVIDELSRLYSIRPSHWANIQHPANFPRGSWVVVIHGDPGTIMNGPDLRATVLLTDGPAATRPEPFWVELMIIDYSAPLLEIAD